MEIFIKEKAIDLPTGAPHAGATGGRSCPAYARTVFRISLHMSNKYDSEGWAVCIADIQDEEGRKVSIDLMNQKA